MAIDLSTLNSLVLDSIFILNEESKKDTDLKARSLSDEDFETVLDNLTKVMKLIIEVLKLFWL